jgi:hypothetical protein
MDRAADNSHVRRLIQRAADEARRFVVMFLYLWVLLGLFVLNETIILGQRGMSFSSQGFALLNALVLAKVMLVVEDLNIARGLPRRPLIYRIVFESLLLAILFICFHVLEHLVVGLIKREDIAASVPAIGGGGLTRLICAAVILFVTLMPFFAFKNLGRELGANQLNAMLFGTAIKSPDDR